ncbi:DegT/DnrJ/EryC1/StrS family aminotransferase [Flavobacteriales bacterium AH-315-E23]|nr:DegT/DnrJ/EryC1/StrS family aminotransferase [Flavobacteriales bacterium AH-315-E23]
MRKIQMVDLVSQYEKIREEVDAAMLNVVRSSAYIRGSEVKGFEEELATYLGVQHVISCGNGTDALQIALMALGLERGDEIITTSFTFIATVEVISLLGLTPVMVDVEPGTFNIDPGKIEDAITDRTRAILPVHLYGQCADMGKIMEIAKNHGLPVIEDTAQAISADYTFEDGTTKKAGTIGNIGCTSFFPSKNLGCFGDGGALFTDDESLAEQMRIIANHGMKVRYYHEVIGVNSRLDNLQAAVLRIKLRRLDEYKAARNAVAAHYDNAFAELSQIETPERNPNSTHAFHQYTLKCNGIDRDELKEHLASKEIPSMIYYPVALHQQKAFEVAGLEHKSLPVTETLCNQVISLPIHTEMDEEQLGLISGGVLDFTNSQ